jgi:histidine triad (HIT) family protein
MALEPPVPGLPEGSRISMSLREPNSDRLLVAARTASQSPTRSMKNTSRSSKPARFAAARMASAASPTSRASSPVTRYARAGSPERCLRSVSNVSFKARIMSEMAGRKPYEFRPGRRPAGRPRILRCSRHARRGYMATIFEKIIAGEIPATIVHKDDRVTAFRDISPQAPVHVLIIPNKPIPTVNDVADEDERTLGHMFVVARDIAQREGIAENGFRLIVNCNKHGGQVVFHLHMHLLGGAPLGPMLAGGKHG